MTGIKYLLSFLSVYLETCLLFLVYSGLQFFLTVFISFFSFFSLDRFLSLFQKQEWQLLYHNDLYSSLFLPYPSLAPSSISSSTLWLYFIFLSLVISLVIFLSFLLLFFCHFFYIYLNHFFSYMKSKMPGFCAFLGILRSFGILKRPHMVIKITKLVAA